MINNNNRKTLVEILAQHTGTSNKYVIENIENINLKEILTTTSDCPIDTEDLQVFNMWRSLQTAIGHMDLT